MNSTTLQLPEQQVDPTLMADPIQQQKLAENVLTQLGLHPNQQGARSLLDSHFAGPTASPEVSKVVAPLIKGPATDAPNPVKGEVAPVKPAGTMPQLPEEPKTPVAPTSASVPALAATSTSAPSSAPSIPAPDNGMGRLMSNSVNQTGKAQSELSRLIDTGSGIHQIKNPFLKGLSTAGELAADAFAPNLVKDIPGTQAHHEQLINTQQKAVDSGLKNVETEATAQHTEQETDKSKQDLNELSVWMKENPGKNIDEYWKDKAEAQNLKLTPQQQVMRYLTSPKADGGMELTPDDAFAKMNKILGDSKPVTGAQQKQEFEGLMSKVMPNGEMDPKMMSDAPALVKAISASPNLTPEEKSKAFAYLVSNTTPASSAYAPNSRAATMRSMRLSSAMDRSGNLLFVTPEMVAQHPDAYMPATQGTQALTKESIFQDLDFNTANLENGIKSLKSGFDTASRAQLAIALRSSDPKSAIQQFMQGEIGQSLTPDQVDYITDLASLTENAMAMRSIAGMGTGSDELRAAITKTIPGPGTPDADYALRQLELFKGTINRLRTGVAHTGVQHPSFPAPKSTQEIHDENQGKTFTEEQIQKEVDKVNEAHKSDKNWKPITLDQAVKEAESLGHKVVKQ